MYHITDVPSFLSRERLTFFDPQEKFFGTDKNGFAFDKIPEHSEDIFVHSKDQLLPYFQNLPSPYRADFKKSYEATLFRFPLRTVKSELSQNLFSTEKVKSLFDAFIEQDASISLLFLKNIRTIEFYRIPAASELELVYSLELEMENFLQRKSLHEFILENSKQFYDFLANTDRDKIPKQAFQAQVRIFNKTKNKSITEKWACCSQIGCGNEYADMRNQMLKVDSLFRAVPLAGVAALLSGNSLKVQGKSIYFFFFLFISKSQKPKVAYFAPCLCQKIQVKRAFRCM